MRNTRFLTLIAATGAGMGLLAAPASALPMRAAADVTASQPLSAEMQTKLDTKSAHTGEAVTAKTISYIVLGDGTTVPRGAVLTGTVTEAQSSANGTASLAIVFDHLRPTKKAASIAIHGVLVGIAPKPYLANNGPSNSNLPLASNRPVGNLAGATGGSMDNTPSDEEIVATGSAMRGVRLSSSSGNNAGTLSSNRNFKLDKGTQIAVGLESK